jgi:hypothetical protein
MATERHPEAHTGEPSESVGAPRRCVFPAAFRLWNCFVLGVRDKLTFTYSLGFWDFNASVTPFPGIGRWVSAWLLARLTTSWCGGGAAVRCPSAGSRHGSCEERNLRIWNVRDNVHTAFGQT